MGKPKYIETPEALWDLFQSYIANIETLTYEVVHPKLGVTQLSVKAPVTMEGFKTFGHNNGVTIKHYIDNPDNAYDNYRTIITRIKDYIFQYNFNRAAVGIYKENLIARQLGIADKQETTIKEQPLFPDDANV